MRRNHPYSYSSLIFSNQPFISSKAFSCTSISFVNCFAKHPFTIDLTSPCFNPVLEAKNVGRSSLSQSEMELQSTVLNYSL